MKQTIRCAGRFDVFCIRDGRVIWSDTAKNLVVDEGLNYVLDILLKNGTRSDPWYVGLTSSSPTPAASDTMSSHSGWSEVTSYSENARQEFVDGAISNKTVSNENNEATFTITSSVTVGGAFMTSSSTKGGTTGTLLCVAAFSGGNRSLQENDVLKVRYSFTVSSS